MPDTVKALLFDFGNVLVDIDFARTKKRWAEHANRDPEQIEFSPDDAYRKHERGLITDAEYFASLRSSLAIDISDRQFLDGWNALFGEECPGISALLQRAAAYFPLYVFSNSNPAHEAYWRAQFADLLAPFREVLVSSTIGFRKPDVAAFLHVAEMVGVAPESILFFDDMPENVEGARAAGFKAVQVRSTDDVAAALRPLLPPS